MRVSKEQRKAFALAAGFGVLSLAGFFFIPVILDGDESTKINQSISLVNSIDVSQALGPIASSLYTGTDQKIKVGDVFISENRSMVYDVKQIRQLSDGQYFIVANVKDVKKFKSFREFVLSRGNEKIINLYDFLNETDKAYEPAKQVRELFLAYNQESEMEEFASVADPERFPPTAHAIVAPPPVPASPAPSSPTTYDDYSDVAETAYVEIDDSGDAQPVEENQEEAPRED